MKNAGHRLSTKAGRSARAALLLAAALRVDRWARGPLCKAKRGSRLRSSALTECLMLPSQSSPLAKRILVPLMRGEPSRRSVAMVLWAWASKKLRARATSSGASASRELQLGMANKLLI
jgi:hypothetical protein